MYYQEKFFFRRVYFSRNQGGVRCNLFQEKLQKDILKMLFLTPGLQKFCAQRRVNGVYSSSEENYFRRK
jgi:hypothetical protein